jgi:hypothetical protein
MAFIYLRFGLILVAFSNYYSSNGELLWLSGKVVKNEKTRVHSPPRATSLKRYYSSKFVYVYFVSSLAGLSLRNFFQKQAQLEKYIFVNPFQLNPY